LDADHSSTGVNLPPPDQPVEQREEEEKELFPEITTLSGLLGVGSDRRRPARLGVFITHPPWPLSAQHWPCNCCNRPGPRLRLAAWVPNRGKGATENRLRPRGSKNDWRSFSQTANAADPSLDWDVLEDASKARSRCARLRSAGVAERIRQPSRHPAHPSTGRSERSAYPGFRRGKWPAPPNGCSPEM